MIDVHSFGRHCFVPTRRQPKLQQPPGWGRAHPRHSWPPQRPLHWYWPHRTKLRSASHQPQEFRSTFGQPHPSWWCRHRPGRLWCPWPDRGGVPTQAAPSGDCYLPSWYRLWLATQPWEMMREHHSTCCWDCFYHLPRQLHLLLSLRTQPLLLHCLLHRRRYFPPPQQHRPTCSLRHRPYRRPRPRAAFGDTPIEWSDGPPTAPRADLPGAAAASASGVAVPADHTRRLRRSIRLPPHRPKSRHRCACSGPRWAALRPGGGSRRSRRLCRILAQCRRDRRRHCPSSSPPPLRPACRCLPAVPVPQSQQIGRHVPEPSDSAEGG
mmetsp:Transcript_32850/g.96879  ORF Transcript_32850/g.96879 Transcript_32850/m.96879 type:complete len:323 (-) Transcript_32850:793-1761(-)